jgi:hypothetical protein
VIVSNLDCFINLKTNLYHDHKRSNEAKKYAVYSLMLRDAAS